MTCNCNNNYGCGGACDPCSSNTAIKQAVDDALAAEKETLEGYVDDAAASAEAAAGSAADAASSASAAAQSQTNAETAASTATQAAASVTDTAVVLEETAERIEQAQDLLEEQISALQTKPVYFEVSSPTTSLVLPETETVFNVRSIYVASARQDVGYGFTFDKPTRTITLADEITAEDITDTEEGYILVTAICDIYSSDDPTSFPIILGSNAGAGLVGTSDGSTVQGKFDKLASAQGFTLLGQVESFNALRGIVPTKAGQHIMLASHASGWAATVNGLPIGGGEFVSVEGTGVDDGGHICVPTEASSFYWLRVTDEVKLTDYGVETFSWNATNVTTDNDQSDKVNAACARAVLTGFHLKAAPASYNNSLRGIPVLKTIDITNVRYIDGDLLLFANNLAGNYSEVLGVTSSTGVSQKFVLTNLNAEFSDEGGYTFSSVKGPRHYGTIRVINFGDRTTRLNAQLHFVASSSYVGVFSEGFNGWGIHWGVSQDTVVTHQSASRCGNINQFAIFAYSYPRDTATGSDFCNNLTFQSVICEYSQDRSIFIAGPNVRIDRCHEEGTIVSGNTPDSWGTYTIDTYASGIGSGIANCAFALNNGSCGQLNVIDLNGTSTSNMNVVLNMCHTKYGIVQATRTASNGLYPTGLIIAPGWSGDGGYIGDIRTNQLYTQDTATVIGKVSASLGNIRSPSIQINGASITVMNLYSGTVSGYVGSSSGYVNLGGSTYTARLQDSTILNGNLYVDTSSSADVVITNCLIAGTLTRGRYDGSTVTASGTRPIRISNVTFTGAHDFSTSGAMVEYDNCVFSNLVHSASTYYQLFKGCRVVTYTKVASAWGLWAFDDACVFTTISGTWAWPDTAYANLGLSVTNPLNGRKRKWTNSGWLASEGPFATATLGSTVLTANTTTTTTVTVSGVVLGDTLAVSLSAYFAGVVLSATVSAVDTVVVSMTNTTAADITVAGTLKIKVV